MLLGRRAAAALGVMVAVGIAPGPGEPADAAGPCAPDTTAAGLDAFFGGDDAAGLSGADYPHAIALPDGRTLWLFQDAFVGDDADLFDDRFAHNAALVQDGACFELLPAPGGDGTSFIGSWVEQGLNDWVWPLDAEVGADGNLWVFVAEVHNPARTGAASGAFPLGTWRARYSLPELELIDLQPAADPGRALFGYSIVSDEDWTYLYGHCYTQFASALDAIGFDPDCSPHAYLARVPLGELDDEPEFWDGEGWTDDRDAREPVLTAAQSMPVSVERFGDVYVAVSDEDDWFGADVVVRTAPLPQGPWTEVLRYTPETRCAECNNYGAFVLPRLEGDRVVIAQSNNAWNMGEALADGTRYRIDVRAVDVPGVSAASLTRAPARQPEPVVVPVVAPLPEPEVAAVSRDEVEDVAAGLLAVGDAGDPDRLDQAAQVAQLAVLSVAGLFATAGVLGLLRTIVAGRRRRPAPVAAPAGRHRRHAPRSSTTATGPVTAEPDAARELEPAP